MAQKKNTCEKIIGVGTDPRIERKSVPLSSKVEAELNELVKLPKNKNSRKKEATSSRKTSKAKITERPPGSETSQNQEVTTSGNNQHEANTQYVNTSSAGVSQKRATTDVEFEFGEPSRKYVKQ